MLYIKALHIIFMVTWFAALFYLPRLYVYHAMSNDAIGNARFKVMERKLFWGIMTPGAVATTFFGLWLIYLNPQYYLKLQWLYAKLFLVLLLIIYHIWCYKHLKDFRDDRNSKSHVYYRWFNEAPTILLISIIILAVVKPF